MKDDEPRRTEIYSTPSLLVKMPHLLMLDAASSGASPAEEEEAIWYAMAP